MFHKPTIPNKKRKLNEMTNPTVTTRLGLKKLRVAPQQIDDLFDKQLSLNTHPPKPLNTAHPKFEYTEQPQGMEQSAQEQAVAPLSVNNYGEPENRGLVEELRVNPNRYNRREELRERYRDMKSTRRVQAEGRPQFKVPARGVERQMERWMTRMSFQYPLVSIAYFMSLPSIMQHQSPNS
ncbi:hypothetical protein FGO68_gene6716 [Halteria grandinella]|uniref:Uncharacterized protein n=1 Tax=Halteria grandinella TaxID=5974 RepID=A0A8J8SX60_HALGN|nr:hypothetical protein FGO68_gene6716 [Halteria grandinella]